MNQKELKELIEFLIEKDIAEFELERGDVKVRIRRAGEPANAASLPETRYFAMPNTRRANGLESRRWGRAYRSRALGKKLARGVPGKCGSLGFSAPTIPGVKRGHVLGFRVFRRQALGSSL